MISTGQGSAGTVSSVLTRVPPGPCLVVLANSGTASTVWAGAGTSVTAGNGFPVPSGTPVYLPGYQGDAGTPLSVICSSGSATVGFIISTATGQTGP